MPGTLRSPLGKILDHLERFYGKPRAPRAILPNPSRGADPYRMLLYTNCGYPATDAACTKGFEALDARVGLRPDDILGASDAELTEVFRGTGMMPEKRGARKRGPPVISRGEVAGPR
ncbi:MAG TPA: hypothetical protein VLW54_00640 [Candidatus Acidoferrales bacterium]|nr:hypothetical protein [Candidatus Acidoferrales bacterium]